MEPISTFNFGASLAEQSKSFPLSNLASKARTLTGTQSLNMGEKASTTQTNKDKELMEVAKKFEAILIHQMLKAMRQTVHKSDLMNSFSLQQYESMMDEEIASEMAKNKGIGLADSLFYQLSQLETGNNQNIDLAKKAIELSHQIESLYLKANYSQKKKLIKSVLSNCELKDGSLYPIYNKSFDIFAKGIKSNNKRRGRDSNPG